MNKTKIAAILAVLAVLVGVAQQVVAGQLGSVNWTVVIAAVMSAVSSWHASDAAAAPAVLGPAK